MTSRLLRYSLINYDKTNKYSELFILFKSALLLLFFNYQVERTKRNWL